MTTNAGDTIVEVEDAIKSLDGYKLSEGEKSGIKSYFELVEADSQMFLGLSNDGCGYEIIAGAGDINLSRDLRSLLLDGHPTLDNDDPPKVASLLRGIADELDRRGGP